MGQDKKQLTKLLDFVKEIYDHPDNKEFAAGIQSMVLKDIRDEEKEEWTAQISEIYEYCLRKNLRDQAEDLYKSFPVKGIDDQLVNYFIEMEDARRKNDFDSFGLFLYLQIELVVDTLIKDSELPAIFDGIRKLPPFIKFDYVSKTTVRVADSKFNTVEEYLGFKEKNYGKPLASLPALDRARVAFYIVCSLASVERFPRDTVFSEWMETLSGIYNVRCHDAHSGANVTEKQEWYYDMLLADKTMNYLRFMALLLAFLKCISENYPYPESLKKLAGLA